jgi:hypothetical protein
MVFLQKEYWQTAAHKLFFCYHTALYLLPYSHSSAATNLALRCTMLSGAHSLLPETSNGSVYLLVMDFQGIIFK